MEIIQPKSFPNSLPQPSKSLNPLEASTKRPKVRIIVLVVLVVLSILLTVLVVLKLSNKQILSGDLPSSYDECMSQRDILSLESNKLICGLSIDEQSKWYEECQKYGKTGILFLDFEGSKSYCNLSFRNTKVAFPSDFDSCEALGGMDKVNFPNTCFIRIDTGSFYNKDDENWLVSQCLSQGGQSDGKDCYLIYEKPFSKSTNAVTNFSECESSQGETISSTFQPQDYYGYSNQSIMIPRCTINYNSVSNRDLFDQCQRQGGTVSPDVVIRGSNSENCHLVFYNLPEELNPNQHNAFTPLFENLEKNKIDNFLYSNGILVIKVASEGLYGKDITNNKQIWFYPVEYGDRDILLSEKNQTLITNVGVNESFKLVSIGLLDGKEKWHVKDSIFYPTYSLTDGNIKILVSKDGAFVRSLLIDSANGDKIEDKTLNESWPRANEDPVYNNLVLKKDFSKVYVVDKATNQVVWEIKLKEGRSSATISLKNIINVNSEDILLVPYEELIYAINLNTGEIDWTYCSKSLFNFAQLDESKIILEAPDRNLYVVNLSKINPGEKIDLFPNSLGLSCGL